MRMVNSSRALSGGWAVLVALVALAGAPVANAMPVYGESADLTGSRDNSATGGLVGSGSWLDEEVTLDWTISQNPDDSWSYEYVWGGAGLNIELGSSRISHFALDVTDDCVGVDDEPADADCITNSGGTTVFGDYDGIIGAVKFDFGGSIHVETQTVTYSFTSNRAPVWGDLCLKDGGGNATCPNEGGSEAYLWNGGFGDQDSSNTLLYVARPNGGSEKIPAPGVLTLLAIGLLGLVGVCRRRG